MTRPRLAVLLLLAGLQCSCDRAARRVFRLPPFTHAYGHVERHRVAMRDGVRLATDVYFPEGAGPWPVVLVRNPYNFLEGFGPVVKLFTRYGYVGIQQYCRGRAPSEGEWVPLLNERNDGIDTLAWLVRQPWQNGSIGLFGASYLSFVQWAVADALPPQVKTMVAMEWGNDVRGTAFQDGMFRPEVLMMWAALMHGHTMDVFNGGRYQRALHHRPQREVDRLEFGGTLPWFQDWISSPSLDAPIWRRPDAQVLPRMPERVTVPVLMLTGWYDIFSRSQIDDFHHLRTRAESRLIVGPWTHLGGIVGDGVKPFPGAGTVIHAFPKILNWFDHALKGAPLLDWGPVETYPIGGGGRWNTWKDWPPPTRAVRLYLRDAAGAHRCDGALAERSDPVAESASYVYDPDHPVPTRGGGGLLAFVSPGWGGALPSVRDQRGLCERPDVLTFVSRRFERDLHVAGRVAVRLTVGSDAPDTSFTAKLIEVDPRGRAFNLQDSITSLAYRNGATLPVAYTPGTPVTVAIDLPPVEWILRKGERLRLDVSSSNFPAYVAHTNLPGLWCDQTHALKAEETLYLGPDRVGWIEVPVWEGGSSPPSAPGGLQAP